MKRYYHYSSSYRAKQHISEAKALTIKLGGADQDVKKYFFALDGEKLSSILDLYEDRYGSRARKYAEKTIHKWRNGWVKMSGTVAERLFSLLPPTMPIETKFDIVEKLWNTHGPTSSKKLVVTCEDSDTYILDKVTEHFRDVVSHYSIPKNIEDSFRWLSHGDVKTYQQLLNHLRQRDLSMLINYANHSVPLILEKLRTDPSIIKAIVHNLQTGRHKLRLEIKDNHTIERERKAKRREDNIEKIQSHFWIIVTFALMAFYFIVKLI